MNNSIIEALQKPAGTRDDLARDLAATCKEAAERNFAEAAEWNATDNKLAGVKSYLKGLEFEKMGACILDSIVFKREPDLTRSEREAMIRRLIGGDV